MLARMTVNGDYLQYVLEQLSGLARVTSRRMFSGVGLYCDGVFFALIHDDTLFFKVDDSNRGDYLARNMSPFRPFRDRPDLSMSYFEVPADALEDRDELAAWARRSVSVATASARPSGRRAKSSARARHKSAKRKSPGQGKLKRAARRAPARKR